MDNLMKMLADIQGGEERYACMINYWMELRDCGTHTYRFHYKASPPRFSIFHYVIYTTLRITCDHKLLIHGSDSFTIL